MKQFVFIIPVILLILSSCNSKSTFFVDFENGNDSNSGNSPSKAWSSLNKINNHTFKPRDKIFFKAGNVWYGQLELKGSGQKGRPVKVSKYGNGNNPVINGNGLKNYTLLLHNVEFWEIRNLEITNTGQNREAGRYGVLVLAENFGDCNHIVLDSLEIHHVNGSLVKNEGGGAAIFWHNKGDSIKTRFNGLYITNCYLHHCERNGINSWGYTNRKDWHPSINVVIKNNLLEQIPGDGIVPIGTHGALIEHNVMRDCPDILSYQEAAAGIWPWSADSTIIQFNEVSGHKAKWDGQGFDSDWNCMNTVIQYNYSHDNYGGFLLVCNNGSNINSDYNIGTSNTVVRCNISVNDGIRPYETKQKGWFSPLMHVSGPVKNTKIYNNIFIVPAKNSDKIDQTILYIDNWGGPWPEHTFFKNNIFFVYNDTARFHFDGDINTVFSGNCFYGDFLNLPEDNSAVYENPGFYNVDARGEGFEILKNFRLNENSPCVNFDNELCIEKLINYL